MALQLTKRFIEYLEQNPENKFTAREISTWIYGT